MPSMRGPDSSFNFNGVGSVTVAPLTVTQERAGSNPVLHLCEFSA